MKDKRSVVGSMVLTFICQFIVDFNFRDATWTCCRNGSVKVGGSGYTLNLLLTCFQDKKNVDTNLHNLPKLCEFPLNVIKIWSYTSFKIFPETV